MQLYHSTEQQVCLGPFHPAYRTYFYGAFPIFQESYKNFLMLIVSMDNLNLNILELSCYKIHPLLQDRLEEAKIMKVPIFTFLFLKSA